jgi:hypothetical protein
LIFALVVLWSAMLGLWDSIPASQRARVATDPFVNGVDGSSQTKQEIGAAGATLLHSIALSDGKRNHDMPVLLAVSAVEDCLNGWSKHTGTWDRANRIAAPPPVVFRPLLI